MAKQSTNKTIVTLGAVAIGGYLVYRFFPLKKRGPASSGGATGAGSAQSPYYPQQGQPSPTAQPPSNSAAARSNTGKVSDYNPQRQSVVSYLNNGGYFTNPDTAQAAAMIYNIAAGKTAYGEDRTDFTGPAVTQQDQLLGYQIAPTDQSLYSEMVNFYDSLNVPISSESSSSPDSSIGSADAADYLTYSDSLGSYGDISGDSSGVGDYFLSSNNDFYGDGGNSYGGGSDDFGMDPSGAEDLGAWQEAN